MDLVELGARSKFFVDLKFVEMERVAKKLGMTQFFRIYNCAKHPERS